MSAGADGIEELQRLLADVERLLRTTLGDLHGEAKVGAGELQASLARLLSMAGELKDTLVHKIENADRRVHDNVWVSVGVCALVAFIAGVIVGHQPHQPHQRHQPPV
ncbi:MAG TPA: hypothetical protein VMD56_05655 [Steroidobacteraceae bacterium]|nr:hypothetical protein [Steroidobacteraceae bacterium]